MKIIYMLFLLMLTLSANGAQISIENYKIDLAKNWVKMDQVNTPYNAVLINPQNNQPIAGLMAKTLLKPVKDEADQMTKAAERQPDTITLLGNTKLDLIDKQEGRVVTLEIKAGNKMLGIKPPMIFRSIYLPLKNGKTATFKLQCSKLDFEKLKLEFDKMVLGKILDKKEWIDSIGKKQLNHSINNMSYQLSSELNKAISNLFHDTSIALGFLGLGKDFSSNGRSGVDQS